LKEKFVMYALKRVLPFVLTLIVGAALGSIGSLMHTRPAKEMPRDFVLESHSCRAHSAFAMTPNNSSPLVIRFKPVATYTDAARRDQISGQVRLRAVFGADGTVSNIETVSTLPDGLTEEAVSAAKRIEFNPATINGEPISVTRTVEYNFNLY
jgi:TonB family protein